MLHTRPGRARPRRAAVALAAAALLLSGCGDGSRTEDGGDGSSADLPAPPHADDDTVPLSLGLVSPAGQESLAPISADGEVRTPEDGPTVQEREVARTEPFGCQDTVSVVRTVPMLTEDPVFESLRFLIEDTDYEHGDPAFANPLAVSDDLTLESTEVDGDTITVELSGEIVARGACESRQLFEQLDATARAAAGAEEAEVLLDGEPLAEQLGLPADVEGAELRAIAD